MTDKGTVRIVVVFIGVITIVLVAAVCLLAVLEKPAPTALEIGMGTALGSLVTLLASTRSTPEGEAIEANVIEARDVSAPK